MTVTYKGEDPAGRRGRNSKGVRTYTRVFKLETTSQSEGPYAVGSNASLPKIGAAHPEDAGAFCTDLTPECVEPWKGWTVTAEYSSEFTLAENPTSDPATITWGSEQFQRVVIVDKNGQAVVNSAGDPFDPPIMADDSRRVVTVTKNLANVPTWILTYQDAVNSDTFTVDGVSISAGIAKMQAVTVSTVQSRNATSFRQVTFTMHFNPGGWKAKPLDAGFRQVVYGGGLENIRNPGDDELPAAPVPLNGNGQAEENPSPTNCFPLEFTVYNELAFSSLPLT